MTEPSLTDDIEGEATLDELRASNLRLMRKAAQAKAKTTDLVEAVYQASRDAAVTVGRPEIVPPPKDRRKPKGETALWHLTDWQGGKHTISYGLDVMDRRVQQFARKAVEITRMQRADHPVRKLVILFGGDMLENVTTFPGQVWEVEAGLYVQFFRVAGCLESVVRYALAHYEEVEVVAEPGNHGRVGRKHDGVQASDNYDRIIYKIAADRLADEKRLTWHQDNAGWYQRVEIGNYRAMLIHGDEVKGFGGNTPAYALVRKGNAWASGAVPFPFRDIYVGHYHNHNDYALAAGGTVFMTGSTESDNEFAREFVAASSQPSQRLHFIDHESGRVGAQYKIYLD